MTYLPMSCIFMRIPVDLQLISSALPSSSIPATKCGQEEDVTIWRLICAVVLLPSLVIAQSQEVAVPMTVPASDHHRATWVQATYYSELRRGTGEKAAVELVLPNDFTGYFVTSPQSPMPGIVPLNLELEAPDGITITRVEYPQTFKMWTDQGNVRVADSGVIRFRINARRDTRLGPHLVKGRLTFQLATAKGISLPPEKIDVQLALNVVEHNAKVTKSWPYHWDPSNKELILLLPVIIIFAIFQSLGCATGFGCSS